MKLIIAGSRSADSHEFVTEALKESKFIISDITQIVSGGANGVDKLGEYYARSNGISLKVFPAIWKPDGVFDRQAGHKRNAQMGDYADALLAIWDGYSAGTRNMIQYMKKLGKPVYVYVFTAVDDHCYSI